jgi:putative zinc finger/helix-turn-helix YgiT family protein
MICLKCKNEDFLLRPDAVVEQEFRGETFNVVSPVVECEHCGWRALAEGQMDELGRRTSDAFRKKHGLLTSEEIKELRMSLNMSQRQFAEFLRVGEASVKRWENWKIQDASSDELIRLKCMMAKAVSKPSITGISCDFTFPSATSSCTGWHTFAQISPQAVLVSPYVEGASWLVGGKATYAAFLDEFMRSQNAGWTLPQSQAPLSYVSFYGPVQPSNLDGRPPPEDCDASRFSFPMPSPAKKASEKKTILIQSK